MRRMLHRCLQTLGLVAAIAAVLLEPGHAHATKAVTAHDGRLWQGSDRFHVYGYNYGPHSWRWLCSCIPPMRGDAPPSFRYFDNPTSRGLRLISKDFTRARRYGANTIRIYIELGHVMRTSTRPRVRTLRALAALLRVAERRRVLLDITGNLVWRPERAPHWYNQLSDRARWAVQARFWRYVARVGARSPAVLAYELTSEPVIIPGGDWYQGLLGGYRFAPNIARDVVPPKANSAARSWIRQLRHAIRSVDPRHLIGLGMLPWVGDWSFGPSNVARLLDVLFVHSYAADGQVQKEVSVVSEFAASGRPVVLGETYPYAGSLKTQGEFLVKSSPYVRGQLSFFLHGEPVDGVASDPPNAHYRAALKQFVGLKGTLADERGVGLP
jgi:hypothetical protein